LSLDPWNKRGGHEKIAEIGLLAQSYGEPLSYLIVSKVSKQMLRAFTELIQENDVEVV